MGSVQYTESLESINSGRLRHGFVPKQGNIFRAFDHMGVRPYPEDNERGPPPAWTA